jgi:hypothetical protein
MNDAEAELAMTSSHRLGNLSGSLPFLGIGRNGRIDIVTDPGSEVMMYIGVVGVAHVELG